MTLQKPIETDVYKKNRLTRIRHIRLLFSNRVYISLIYLMRLTEYENWIETRFNAIIAQDF